MDIWNNLKPVGFFSPIRHCLYDSSCIHCWGFPPSPERSAGHHQLPVHHWWPVHCQRDRWGLQLPEPRQLEVCLGSTTTSLLVTFHDRSVLWFYIMYFSIFPSGGGGNRGCHCLPVQMSLDTLSQFCSHIVSSAFELLFPSFPIILLHVFVSSTLLLFPPRLFDHGERETPPHSSR